MYWVVIGLVTTGVAIPLVTSWRRRRSHVVDLGAVSHQWIAEHRLGSGDESGRWEKRQRGSCWTGRRPCRVKKLEHRSRCTFVLA